ncbi:hypothetical protein GUITHDRAFT_64205 [Guillardia theta CCMP2712]|uniref:Serine/threonine-protein kinase PLK n=1 Tax=Guillardia theta (strain CCMP2712) TaxID=905079 RepID=L1JZ37_GUITC|nr:hypothetical protein GUITHDRAFT_64205 [Guillardia theta CCMP2712]EKX53816.1 hypothetical protein GUITHDRAFT_64205 [Guillardia theta CCMP2712]|eukprot:XP_005840796.1 hypothetical protein GUITHDRAFT_64205 [Guillardia theta CCMP2712]
MTNQCSSRPLSAPSFNSLNSNDSPYIEHTKKDSRGVLVTKRYLKGGLLGKGGFAKCFKITDVETNQDWACKVVQKSSLTKHRHKVKLQTEIKIHKSLSHKHVVRFEDVFEDKENVYIIMELCTNQTMLEFVKRKKRLTESETRRYMLQMLDGVRYLHQNKVIHRDLKLGNLFLNHGDDVKIGDFGLACKLQFDGERKRTLCGTPNYIAPEVLDGKNGHSYEVDTWSIGVVMYTCLVGKPPFETADVKSTYKLIKANTYTFPDRLLVSDAAKSLVRRILKSEPELRPSIDDVSAAMQGKFCILTFSTDLKVLDCSPRLRACSQVQEPIRPAPIPSLGSAVIPRASTAMDTKSRAGTGKERRGWAGAGQSSWRAADGAALSIMHNNIKQAFNVQQAAGKLDVPSSTDMPLPSVWVSRWVDYSKKYGLGYKLSNGCSGVFFNDATKMLLALDGENVDYIERMRREDGVKYDIRKPTKLKGHPADLTKKVTLMEHFKNYLDETHPNRDSPLHHPVESREEELARDGVYVRKWMRTRHSIIFRLSNNNFQVNFFDDTEVVLWADRPWVTYKGKNKFRNTYNISDVVVYQEMSKRIKYVKDILSQLVAA